MKYLITSAIPYINGIKHLGNLVGSMLPADVFARFQRQRGHDVLYICGTDEHGTPAEIAAEAEKVDIKTYCDAMYQKQKEIYENFKLSFDYFGRSSSPTNHELTTEIFLDLKEKGFVTEREIEQYFSIDDNRFLPDRYLMGTCHQCGSEKARGDQCDNCGILLDPKDLIAPYSSLSGSKNLELRKTKHYFLELHYMEEKLRAWIDQHDDWPSVTKGIAQKWLKEGLKERCITRDLKWGIPVPNHPDKVFYVWFDAPNAYISMTKEHLPDTWQDWWKNENTHYYQFMAKDNVAFHAIFWPAVLIAHDKNYKLVDYLKSMSWLQFEGNKFSTSKSHGIFLDEALKMHPSDYWRYYLMANIPETDDTNFTYEHFTATVNKDLADVLGNFVNRVINLVDKRYNGRVSGNIPLEWHDKLHDVLKEIIHNFQACKFRQAMTHLREFWTLGNAYIAEKEPWKMENCEHVLSQALHIMYMYAVVSRPIVPDVSDKILSAFGKTTNDLAKFDLDLLNYKCDVWEVKPIGQLFEKIGV